MTTVSLTLSQVFEFALKAYQAGKLSEAEQLCLKLLSADPDSAPTLNLLAVINSALGRNDAALSNTDRALSLWPDFVEALVNRGIALYELKRFGEALADYDRAIALRPDHADALVNRGNALGKLRRPTRIALRCSRSTLRRLPTAASPCKNLTVREALAAMIARCFATGSCRGARQPGRHSA